MGRDPELLDEQAEDMYGRPTGPRHEELDTRAREADLEALDALEAPRHEEGEPARRGEPEGE